MTHTAKPAQHPGEAGYLLAAAAVMTAILLIALAVAAPVIARDIRRDKEVESMHRSEQYVRAIRLYYRKFKSYPPSMEALEKSNNIRFLRKQYDDPLTGKPDWRIIHVGENQTTVKGFFGEPLGGLNATGTGSSIGSGLGSASGMASNIGGTPGSSTPSTTVSGSGLSAGFSGAQIGGSSTPGTSGTSGTGNGLGSASGMSSSGGVGQIMGVATARSGSSILTPNQQETYDTWEFLYDPRIEQMYAKSNILGGGIGSQSASSFGSDATSGKNNTGTGTNGMNGLGGTSPTTPTTTTPQ